LKQAFKDFIFATFLTFGLVACFPVTPGQVLRTATAVADSGCNMAKDLPDGKFRDVAKSICTNPLLDVAETIGGILPAPELTATVDAPLPQRCRFTRDLRGEPEWDSKCAGVYPLHVEEIDRTLQAVNNTLLIPDGFPLPRLSTFVATEDCGGHGVERIVYCPATETIQVKEGQIDTYGVDRFNALLVIVAHEVYHYRTHLERPDLMRAYGSSLAASKEVELYAGMYGVVTFFCKNNISTTEGWGRFGNFRSFITSLGAGPTSAYGTYDERVAVFNEAWTAAGCA